MALANFSIISASFHFNKMQNKGVPTLEFGYREYEKSKQQEKRITKRRLDKAFKKWYALPVTQDFDVIVRNELTKHIDNTRSKAVKLFLVDIKQESSFVYAKERQYIRSGDTECNDFIIQKKWQKKNYEIQNKYRELYYIYRTIIKIAAGEFNKEKADANYRFKARSGSLPDNIFYFDIEKKKAESKFASMEFELELLRNSNEFSCDIIKLDTNIICEDIVPAYYAMLGRQTDDFIADNPQICQLDRYEAYRL